MSHNDCTDGPSDTAAVAALIADWRGHAASLNSLVEATLNSWVAPYTTPAGGD